MIASGEDWAVGRRVGPRLNLQTSARPRHVPAQPTTHDPRPTTHHPPPTNPDSRQPLTAPPAAAVPDSLQPTAYRLHVRSERGLRPRPVGSRPRVRYIR